MRKSEINPDFSSVFVQSAPVQDARELQAMLYREIGISAVASALFMANEMGRSAAPTSPFARDKLDSMPALLRGHIAA